MQGKQTGTYKFCKKFFFGRDTERERESHKWKGSCGWTVDCRLLIISFHLYICAAHRSRFRFFILFDDCNFSIFKRTDNERTKTSVKSESNKNVKRMKNTEKKSTIQENEQNKQQKHTHTKAEERRNKIDDDSVRPMTITLKEKHIESRIEHLACRTSASWTYCLTLMCHTANAKLFLNFRG